MLWAASMLAFFGFLQSSEYTFPSKFKYHKSSTLQLRDITLQKSRVLIHIKASKTDPFREGITLSIARTRTSVCPVRAITKYCQVRPKSRGPFFQTASKQYLTRGMMSQLIKDTLKVGNFDSHRFSSHSLRIGAATSAASAGIPDRTIRALGRWSSDCCHKYVRLSLNALTAVPGQMASVKKSPKPGFLTSLFIRSIATMRFVLWGSVWVHEWFAIHRRARSTPCWVHLSDTRHHRAAKCNML